MDRQVSTEDEQNVSPRHFVVAFLAVAVAGPVSGEEANPTHTPADKAFLGAIGEMMGSLHQSTPTGDTDNDFVRMMVPHHQAAVDMAKAELQFGKDEGLKAMAQEIVTAQQKEIALMKAWEDKKRGSH